MGEDGFSKQGTGGQGKQGQRGGPQAALQNELSARPLETVKQDGGGRSFTV